MLRKCLWLSFWVSHAELTEENKSDPSSPKQIENKEQVVYIVDEEDDKKACPILGIKFELQ